MKVTVTDNNTNNDPNGPKSATTNFTLTVVNVNRPPSLGVIASPITVLETATSDTPLVGNDPDGNSTLTFSVTKTSGPASSAFATITNPTTNGTATLHLAPQIGDNGTFTFTVTVNDNDPVNPLTASQTITVVVNYNDRPPVLTLPGNVPVTMNENDAAATVTVSATDPDLSRTDGVTRNPTFSINVTALNTELQPANTSFISIVPVVTTGLTRTANVVINPLALNGRAAGNYTVSVTVNDNDTTGPNGTGPKTDNKTFQVTVVNVAPTAPQFNPAPPTSMNEGTTADIAVSSTDIGGNNLLALTVTVTPAPAAAGSAVARNSHKSVTYSAHIAHPRRWNRCKPRDDERNYVRHAHRQWRRNRYASPRTRIPGCWKLHNHSHSHGEERGQ